MTISLNRATAAWPWARGSQGVSWSTSRANVPPMNVANLIRARRRMVLLPTRSSRPGEVSWVQRRAKPWMAVVALTLALTPISTRQALMRYEEFRSGFSWDLAYYNQWFWAITRGDDLVTVRPLSAYAEE